MILIMYDIALNQITTKRPLNFKWYYSSSSTATSLVSEVRHNAHLYMYKTKYRCVVPIPVPYRNNMEKQTFHLIHNLPQSYSNTFLFQDPCYAKNQMG